MDDLSRIEAVYGSVTEYNRQRFEEEQNDYWNSLSDRQRAELQKKERDKYTRYKRQIAELTPDVTTIASDFKKQYDSMPKIRQESFYQDRDRLHDFTINAYHEIQKSHGVSATRDSFRNNLEKGKFAISYAVTNSGPIQYESVYNLDKNEFLSLYTDMRLLGGYTVAPYYRDTKESVDDCMNLHTVTGVSAGEMRLSYFDSWGVSDPERDEILRKLENAEVKQNSKKDTLNSLASDLTAYINDVDTYEFNDTLEVGWTMEDAVNSTKQMIRNGNVSGIKTSIQGYVDHYETMDEQTDDVKEYINRGNSLINRLDVFEKNYKDKKIGKEKDFSDFVNESSESVFDIENDY